MNRIMTICFMFVIIFMMVGCDYKNGTINSEKESKILELNDEDLNKEIPSSELNDKDLSVNSYKELFIVNTIILTQNTSHNPKTINDRNEIKSLLSILKLQTQKFNEEYLNLKDDLKIKLDNYIKIEITSLSENDIDYLCYYITEEGIIYEQIENYVRYTDQNAINYSELLIFFQ